MLRGSRGVYHEPVQAVEYRPRHLGAEPVPLRHKDLPWGILAVLGAILVGTSVLIIREEKRR